MSNDLSTGWKWTTLGEISDVVGGGTPSTKVPLNFEGGEIPWLTPADLSGYSSKHISRGERCITEAGFKNSSAKMLPAGTVLFTSRAPIGYVAIASNPVCTNQGFKSFILKEGVLSDYVYWWLKGNKALAESFASGTTFLELSGAKAKQLPIPLPPTIDDQRRIVAEIEKQLSRLDESVTALKRIQANLKRYKAAVLKAAVEGKLTEQWRKDHPDVEPADQLLKRILAERRARWEAEELAKMKAKGIKPKDDSWKKKYKEPAGPDTANLPELPEGWVWASAHAVSKITSGFAFKSNEFTDSGTPAIKIANVSYGQFLWKQQEYLPESFLGKYVDFQVKPGEVLLALTRPITDDSVKVCVYPFDAPIGLLNQRVALLKVVPGYDKKFLLHLMQAEPFKNQIKSGLSETLQPNLSPLDLQMFSVPIPSEAEQLEIVAEIDRRLSVTEELEATIETSLKRAERLRQTILQQAFAGKLLCKEV